MLKIMVGLEASDILSLVALFSVLYRLNKRSSKKLEKSTKVLFWAHQVIMVGSLAAWFMMFVVNKPEIQKLGLWSSMKGIKITGLLLPLSNFIATGLGYFFLSNLNIRCSL